MLLLLFGASASAPAVTPLPAIIHAMVPEDETPNMRQFLKVLLVAPFVTPELVNQITAFDDDAVLVMLRSRVVPPKLLDPSKLI